MRHTLPMTYQVEVIRSNIEVTKGQIRSNLLKSMLISETVRESVKQRNIWDHMGYNG